MRSEAQDLAWNLPLPRLPSADQDLERPPASLLLGASLVVDAAPGYRSRLMSLFNPASITRLIFSFALYVCRFLRPQK